MTGYELLKKIKVTKLCLWVFYCIIASIPVSKDIHHWSLI